MPFSYLYPEERLHTSKTEVQCLTGMKNHASQTIQSETSHLTLLNTGIQLRDLNGQTVNAVLEGIGTPIKGVGLIEKLSKNIFCMLTCKKSQRDFLYSFIISP